MKLNAVLKKGTRVAIYCRYSTNKQELASQKSACEKLAGKYGCEIVDRCRYYDEGVSATKKTIWQRPRLKDMLDDMEKDGLFDAVITYNSDRLARNPLEHQFIRDHAKNHNVQIVLSATELFYDMGDLVSQLVKDGLTKFESDTTRDRTRDTFKYKTQKGELIGGILPYGYKRNQRTGVIEKEPDKIEIVEKIFEMYKHGKGFNAIAAALGQKDNLKSWRKDHIKSIITNPFYAGFTTMNRINKDHHCTINDRSDWIIGESEDIPKVIDKEVWEYCFKLYENKKNHRFSPKFFQTDFLLKDLVYCGECDLPLETKNQLSKGNNNKEYGSRIYRCPNYLGKIDGEKACGIRFGADEIHKVIKDLFRRTIITKKEIGQEGYFFRSVLRSFDADIKNLSEEIDNLKEALGNFAKDMERANEEIRSLLKDGKEHKDLLTALTLYRYQIRNNSKSTKEMIKKKQEKMTYIQTALKDFSLWKEIHQDFMKKNDSARRTFLHLIQKIEVNPHPQRTSMNWYIEDKVAKETFDQDRYLLTVTFKTDLNLSGEDLDSLTILDGVSNIRLAEELDQAITQLIREKRLDELDPKDMVINLKVIEE